MEAVSLHPLLISWCPSLVAARLLLPASLPLSPWRVFQPEETFQPEQTSQLLAMSRDHSPWELSASLGGTLLLGSLQRKALGELWRAHTPLPGDLRAGALGTRLPIGRRSGLVEPQAGGT